MNLPRTAPASAASPPAPTGLRAASTLVVVRDAPVGIEVLLLRRVQSGSDAYSGAWVFPGGMVDARDRECHGLCPALDDATASRQLDLAQGGLDYFIAAVRECFEECGLLYANDKQGDARAADSAASAVSVTPALARWRVPLHRGEIGLADLCREEGLALALERLTYFGHWVTPIGRPKRFDTRFFLAEAPPGQTATHDDVEMVEQRWFHPADALAHGAELKLLTPTIKMLEAIARFDSVPALLAWASAPRPIVPSMPHMGTGRQGLRPVAPDEPAWAELRHIDPEGRGNGRYEIVPDEPVRLSARVIRVSADNGSVMTGPGTNTYLIAGGNNEWAVIDPGPLRRGARAGGARRRARPDPLDLRDAHASRSFAGHGAAEGAHRCARAWPHRRPSGVAGRDLRRRRVAGRRRAIHAGRRLARCVRSTRPAMRPTTSAICSKRRRRSSPATT